MDRKTLAALALLTGGMFLLLWLCLRQLERFMRTEAQLLQDSVQAVLNPQNPQPTAARDLYSTPVDGSTDPETPVWAVGLNPEDLMANRDPWSPSGSIQRPLEY